MKIRDKLLFSVISATVAVSTLMIYLSYASGRRALVTEIQNGAQNMLEKYAFMLDEKMEEVQELAFAEGTAIANFRSGLTEKNIENLIRDFLKGNAGVYGTAIAFVPGSFGEKRLAAPYFYRGKTGDLVYVDLSSENYNYPERDWFKIPLKTGRPRWSPPYYDEGGGGVAMITYSFPFFKDGKVWGVATADASLGKLTEIVESIKVGKTGFAFLIDREGTFLSLRNRQADKNFRKTIFEAAKENGGGDLGNLARNMTSRKSGFVSIGETFLGKRAWFAYAPLKKMDWSLGIIFPEDELLTSLAKLHRNIVVIAVAGLFFIIAVVFYISSRISRPIKLLADDVKKISAGNFRSEMEFPRTKDEVGVLAKAFLEMKNSLAVILEQLKEEKEIFDVAFTHMRDGFVILDENGRVLQFNKAAERILGLPVKGSFAEYLKKNFKGNLSFLEPEGCTEKEIVFELERHRENSATLRLQCVVTNVFGDTGNLKERILSVRDVTGAAPVA